MRVKARQALSTKASNYGVISRALGHRSSSKGVTTVNVAALINNVQAGAKQSYKAPEKHTEQAFSICAISLASVLTTFCQFMFKTVKNKKIN